MVARQLTFVHFSHRLNNVNAFTAYDDYTASRLRRLTQPLRITNKKTNGSDVTRTNDEATAFYESRKIDTTRKKKKENEWRQLSNGKETRLEITSPCQTG